MMNEEKINEEPFHKINITISLCKFEIGADYIYIIKTNNEDHQFFNDIKEALESYAAIKKLLFLIERSF